jgi:hypothetical protein
MTFMDLMRVSPLVAVRDMPVRSDDVRLSGQTASHHLRGKPTRMTRFGHRVPLTRSVRDTEAWLAGRGAEF